MGWGGGYVARYVATVERPVKPFEDRRLLIWAGALMAAAQLLGLVAPYLVKIAIDDGIAAGEASVLLWVGVAGVAIYGLMALSKFGGTWFATRAGEEEWERYRNRLFQHVQNLPLQRLKDQRVGDLAARIYGDTYQLKQLATSVMPAALSLVIGVGGAVVILLVLAPQLVLLAVLPIPLAFLVIRWFRKYVRPLSKQRMERYGRLHSHLHEALSGAEDARALNAQQELASRVEAAGAEMKAADLRLAWHRSRLGPAADFGISLMLLGTLVAGGMLAIQGTLTVGTVVVFYFYVGRCLGPMRSIPGMVYGWHSARAAQERIGELLAMETEAPVSDDAEEAPPGPLSVEARALRFQYESGTAALDGLELSIPAGGRVAILGPSGVGKSTTARHLLRLLPADAGDLLLQGIPVIRWRTADLRRRVGYVGQEVFLFDGTLAQNLTLGLDEDPPEDDLLAACETAQLGDLLETRGGLEFPVGESGGRLSGGQRKRVALARALLRGPDLLIIDQMATDLEEGLNERIFEALRLRGLTLVYFGHRVPAGLQPEAVYWMERGQLSPYEPGRFEEAAPAVGRG